MGLPCPAPLKSTPSPVPAAGLCCLRAGCGGLGPSSQGRTMRPLVGGALEPHQSLAGRPLGGQLSDAP